MQDSLHQTTPRTTSVTPEAPVAGPLTGSLLAARAGYPAMGVILALGLLLITVPMTAVALRGSRGTQREQQVVEIPLEAVPARRTAYDTAGPRQAAATAAPGPGTT